MEITRDPQTRDESKTRLVDQIDVCLRAGEYSRALDLLRAADIPHDAKLSELEKLAQDGVKRNAEVQRLITESQELFAQRKSAEALQRLREAYELDKKNSLARSILANALVEHAQSVVESDWLEAEKLTNQALNLNPAHPTAKRIHAQIVDQKTSSSVDDWVAKASKLHSSGDLFGALAWVAEGLAVHPDDPKLLQIHDEIQRDQATRQRQARRGDVEDLRRMQREIEKATDVAAKQALAVRIQAVAAKHWTDGEILSIANALLLRLGMVAQDSSAASPRGKGATLILHVPRPSAPEAARAASSAAAAVAPAPVAPSQVAASAVQASAVPSSPIPPSPVPSIPVPSGGIPVAVAPAANVLPIEAPVSQASSTQIPASEAPASAVPPTQAPSTQAPPTQARVMENSRKQIQRRKARTTPPQAEFEPPRAATVPAVRPSVLAAKVASAPLRSKPSKRSNTTVWIVASAVAIVLFAAVLFFFARKHAAPTVATTTPAASTSAPAASAPAESVPAESAPAAPVPTTAETTPSAVPTSSAADAGVAADQPSSESGRNLGGLMVVAGQDNASVFLNGKLQRQVTHAGQLRISNLEPRDYVVQVSKSGFQDPPQQTIHVRQGEQARLVFNLQPQLRPATLVIQGAVPGTAVFVDQNRVGMVQPDGTLLVSTVDPGDHTVELRKERFKPRQLKKHFAAGGTVALAVADAVLEAAPGELKINYSPADAKVAVVKGDFLAMVSSGVPLNLAPGTYTLTARTADGFPRSSTIEVVAGQPKTLEFSLAPTGMSSWEDPGGWKHEGDAFVRRGGNFVLYGGGPGSGTFVFSAMATKGRLLQWVLNYSDAKNYVLVQMDENNFYRSVIRNGNKTDEVIVPHKGDKKSFRTLHVRVSPTEIVHQIKEGNSWVVLDRWAQPGANLSLGKFGFYIPGEDQVALSSFAHYGELNIH